MSDTSIDQIVGAASMQSFGCIACQREHYSDQPIFAEHIGFQNKHGVRNVPSEVVADERAAAHRFSALPTGEEANG